MNIRRIKNRSSKAICGAFEREIVVDSDEVSEVKAELRANGFIIVGTGPAGFGKRKIWFNPAGMNF